MILEGENYKVYFHDNKNMDELEDGSVQLSIIDPPFGINFKGEASNYNRTDDAIEGYVEVPDEEFEEWCGIRMREIYKKLMPGGSCFWWSACVNAKDLVVNRWNNLEGSSPGDFTEDKLLQVLRPAKENGFIRLREIIWDYTFGVYSPNTFTISHQHIFYFVKPPLDKRIWNAKGEYVEDAKSIRRPYNLGKNTNLTETNYQIVEDIVKKCSNPNGLIIDPCLGSGTTLQACINLNRKLVGYEINPNTEKRIREKIVKAKSTLKAWI